MIASTNFSAPLKHHASHTTELSPYYGPISQRRNQHKIRRRTTTTNSITTTATDIVITSLSLSPAYDIAAATAATTSTPSLFNLISQADDVVAAQLTGLSPLTFLIVLGAGLLTSLSPCTLSVLPLTIGYIGGFSSDASSPQNSSNTNTTTTTSSSSSSSPLVRAAAFSAGLASTFAALGLLSSLLGGAYGQIGDSLPILVSIVAVVMGLNLLEVLPFSLPTLDVDTRKLGFGPTIQAYIAGLTFALAASPCSTPVLATLLAYVSTTKDPVIGSALLFTYALGYVAPLLAAAVFTGALQSILEVRKWSGWVVPASGVMLVAGGTYGLLSRVVPS